MNDERLNRAVTLVIIHYCSTHVLRIHIGRCNVYSRSAVDVQYNYCARQIMVWKSVSAIIFKNPNHNNRTLARHQFFSQRHAKQKPVILFCFYSIIILLLIAFTSLVQTMTLIVGDLTNTIRV